MIVVFAIIAAAFAGEEGVRKERATVLSYGAYPYTAAYAPTAYSAVAGYPAVTSYSAWPATGYYNGYNGLYAGVPVARAIW